MPLPARFQQHLRAISTAIDVPEAHLDLPVEAFLDLWIEAVPSFLGLAFIFSGTGPEIVISTLDGSEPDPVGSSIRIPSAGPTDTSARLDIVCYAATPGAFVDFSADAAHILRVPLDSIVIDADLTPAPSTDPADATTVNIATGVLMERGHDVDSAAAALRALATAADVTVVAAARQLIAEVGQGHS